MNQERYEIRGKIGQGGVGAVYRAYDTQLRREVAIKRVLAEEGGASDEEGTRQLLKEATALSAVQHPHIVTVYDSGIDADGPYVVMELISGRTLDEMVERGTLTWSDFREIALQTQEALIAAQDLDLVHRDLKPSNIMVSWLPSGKFQVKIVDFGLAKFSAKPSLQTVDHGDSVFGSIFFMAPEQFERTPLDQRTDMYAMGCLYYYCLTGNYPFNGSTAPEVMSSHLQHKVEDLTDIRPDIPLWAANWCMWHMSRDMDDRPFNAREALQQFLLGAEGTFPGAQGTAKQKAKKLNFSTGSQPTVGTSSVGVSAQTGQQPLLNPDGGPYLHSTSSQQTLPQTGSQPYNVQTSSQPVAAPQSSTQATRHTTTFQGGVKNTLEGLSQTHDRASTRKKVIVGLVSAAVLLGGIGLVKTLGGNSKEDRFKELYPIALNDSATSFPASKDDIEIILNKFADVKDPSQRPVLLKLLTMAQSADGTNISEMIFDVATKQGLNGAVQAELLEYVLGQRKADPVNAKLLQFVKDTKDEKLAVAAIKGAALQKNPEDLDAFLTYLSEHENPAVRRECKTAISNIAKKTEDKSSLSALLVRKFRTAPNEEFKQDVISLLGEVGGETAKEIVRESFSSTDQKTIIAALNAVRTWPDDSLFNTLLEELANMSKMEDRFVRDQGYSTAIEFLSDPKRKRDAQASQSMWRSLVGEAESAKEKTLAIKGLTRTPDDWAFTMIQDMTSDADAEVSSVAKRMIEQIERQKDRKQNLK